LARKVIAIDSYLVVTIFVLRFPTLDSHDSLPRNWPKLGRIQRVSDDNPRVTTAKPQMTLLLPRSRVACLGPL